MLHLHSIFVQYGNGGANELRCEGCYSSATRWKVVNAVFVVALLVTVAIVFLTSVLPEMNKTKREHEQIRKGFERKSKEFPGQGK